MELQTQEQTSPKTLSSQFKENYSCVTIFTNQRSPIPYFFSPSHFFLCPPPLLPSLRCHQRDADDAIDRLDGERLGGRELRIQVELNNYSVPVMESWGSWGHVTLFLFFLRCAIALTPLYVLAGYRRCVTFPFDFMIKKNRTNRALVISLYCTIQLPCTPFTTAIHSLFRMPDTTVRSSACFISPVNTINTTASAPACYTILLFILLIL